MAACQCELRDRQWDPFNGRCRTCGAWHADHVARNLKSRPVLVVSTSPFEAGLTILTREEPCSPKRHKLSDCPFCNDSGLVILHMRLSDAERVTLIAQLTKAGGSWSEEPK